MGQEERGRKVGYVRGNAVSVALNGGKEGRRGHFEQSTLFYVVSACVCVCRC